MPTIALSPPTPSLSPIIVVVIVIVVIIIVYKTIEGKFKILVLDKSDSRTVFFSISVLAFTVRCWVCVEDFDTTGELGLFLRPSETHCRDFSPIRGTRKCFLEVLGAMQGVPAS